MENLSYSFQYIPPQDAPTDVVSWNKSIDLPKILANVEVSLKHHEFAVNADRQLNFNETSEWMHNTYGQKVGVRIYRSFQLDTLAASEEKAMEWVNSIKAKSNEVLALYDARMLERKERIAKAHAECGTVKPPEMEAEPK